MRYKAFISYSHRDEALAQRLHSRLEGYRPPRGLKLPDGTAPERLYPVYRDREEMAASPSLPATIEAALAASDALIVLCSPASAASAWVNEEVRLFAEMKGADRIFPVIVDGHPPACFPPALLKEQPEPLASDLRVGKDEFDDGALKIIAGVWGVSLGVLKDREAARRRVRARLQAGLAAVFSAILVFAGFSERRAAEQEARAEAEARMAEARVLAAAARTTFDQNSGETSVAAMIAVQSLGLGPTPEAQDLLRDALALAPLGAEAAPFRWRTPQVAVSRNGRVAAFMSALSSDGAPAKSAVLRLTPDLEEKDRIDFEGLAEPVFSADGAWMAVGGRTRRLVVQNMASGDMALDQQTDSGLGLAFAPDGAALYAASQLGDILRWPVGVTRAETFSATSSLGARLNVPTLAVSPSGDWLLRAESERQAMVLPIGDGEARKVPFTKAYETLAWSEHEPRGALAHPDGAHFIAWNSFNTGALWSADTMTVVWTFDDISRASSWTAANVISPDGALFARGRGDGDVSVREMVDGAVVFRADHGALVRVAAFLDQPRRVVAAGAGGASIWTLEKDAPATRCATDADLLSLAVEAAGTILLGAKDGRLIRCDAATGAILTTRDFGAPVASIATAGGEIAITLKLSDRADSWTEIAFIDRETGAATRLSLNEPFDQLKLSDDGARAATRSLAKRDVAIWGTASGDLINRFAARGDLVGLTPGGDRLLVDYTALNVFDIATGDRVAQFGDAAGVSSLIATPHEDLLITEGQVDGVWRRWGWSVETGQRLWRSPGAVTLAKGGAAYAEYQKEEALWRIKDRATGDEIGAIPFPGDPWRETISRDGGRIAVSRILDDNSGAETELWDVRANRLIWRKKSGGPGLPRPHIVDLSADYAAHVSSQRNDDGSQAGAIDVFNWSSGEIIFSSPWSAAGTPRIAADRGGRKVVISTSKGTVLHSLPDGALQWSAPENYDRGIVFSPDGTVLFAARPDGRDRTIFATLSSETGDVLSTWSAEMNDTDLAISADGLLAIAALDGADWTGVKAWRVADGALAHAFEMDAAPRQLHPPRDPARLIVGDSAGLVRAFDLATGAEVRRFPMSTRAERGAFSAYKTRAVTSAGARLRYWNVETGEEIASMVAAGEVTALAIRPDGGEIAFVTKRKRPAAGDAEVSLVQIWRPETDAPVEALAAGDPFRLAYDPTGATLLIAEHKDIVRIIDARTLAPRFVLRPLSNGAFDTSPNAQAFTGDGRHLLVRETGSYSQGNTSKKRAGVRVFNAVTGAEVARHDTALFGLGGAVTRNGFYYADVSGRSRHFEIGETSLDQRLDDASADKVLAVPGGDRILVSGYWRDDALIDARTGAGTNLTEKEEDHHTLDAAVDRLGRYVALSRYYGGGDAAMYQLLVFDAKTGTLLAQTQPSELDLRNVEFAEDGEVIIAAQQPESSLITRTSDQGAVFRWRWRNEDPIPLIDDNPVADFAISGDGAWMLTSEGGKSRDTDARFGDMQTRLIRLSDGETRLTQPRDDYGRRVLIDASGGRIGVFSSSSPTEGEIADVNASGGSDPVMTLALDDVAFFGKPLGFLDEGERFVLGERSGARVYALETGVVRRLRTPWRASRYALSPDGAYLAVGGAEQIAIWDLATYEQVAELSIADLYSLTFADAKGRSLIAATRNGVFRLEWDLKTLVSAACDIYRNDEWEAGRRRIVSTDAPGLCAEGD